MVSAVERGISVVGQGVQFSRVGVSAVRRCGAVVLGRGSVQDGGRVSAVGRERGSVQWGERGGQCCRSRGRVSAVGREGSMQ